MVDVTPFWVAGKPLTGTRTFDVRNPFDGSLVASVGHADAPQVEDAVSSAAAARLVTQALPAHVRAAALDHVSRRITERAEEIARVITSESGKPLKWSRAETARAASTFRWAAEEARR